MHPSYAFPFLKMTIDRPVHFSSKNSPTYNLCVLILTILSFYLMSFISAMKPAFRGR